MNIFVFIGGEGGGVFFVILFGETSKVETSLLPRSGIKDIKNSRGSLRTVSWTDSLGISSDKGETSLFGCLRVSPVHLPTVCTWVQRIEVQVTEGYCSRGAVSLADPSQTG